MMLNCTRQQDDSNYAEMVTKKAPSVCNAVIAAKELSSQRDGKTLVLTGPTESILRSLSKPYKKDLTC